MRPARGDDVLRWLLVMVLLAWSPWSLAEFDHGHRAWNVLLDRHVAVAGHGNASTVRYSALKDDRARLAAYLRALSAVGEQDHARWSRAQRLAFLINAYNAFTVELVLDRYPDLQSIKDLGNVFQSAWKRPFFRLLGRTRHLEELEHDLVRAPGAFDDPRIHVALVCASVGCPMLRAEAYVADRLDAQLDDAMRRFLSDRVRNRFDAAQGVLRASRIFDWYRGDFELGRRGDAGLRALFARHADLLADAPDDRRRIRAGDYRLEFLAYDWSLNDARVSD